VGEGVQKRGGKFQMARKSSRAHRRKSCRGGQAKEDKNPMFEGFLKEGGV